TLITSSIRRWMSLAKRFLMGAVIVGVVLFRRISEDLRAVVVFCVEHAHKTKPRRTINGARIEQNGGHLDPSLELLEEREGPVDREQRTRAHDEDQVAERVRIIGHAFGDEVDKRTILRKHRVDGVDDGFGTLLTLRIEPLLERALRTQRFVEAFSQ